MRTWQPSSKPMVHHELNQQVRRRTPNPEEKQPRRRVGALRGFAPRCAFSGAHASRRSPFRSGCARGGIAPLLIFMRQSSNRLTSIIHIDKHLLLGCKTTQPIALNWRAGTAECIRRPWLLLKDPAARPTASARMEIYLETSSSKDKAAGAEQASLDQEVLQ